MDARNLSIRPELYEVWLDSVCQTVKQMDPDWTIGSRT